MTKEEILERNYTKDLSILVMGSGKTTKENLNSNFLDWVFGTAESREVRLVLPMFAKLPAGIRTVIDWGIQSEADFQVIQTKGAPLTRDLSELDDIVRTEDADETLKTAFETLRSFENTDEVFVVMLFNEESEYSQGDPTPTDMHMLAEAKAAGFNVVNLCMGMNDIFPGYETPEEIEHAEKVTAEFEAQQEIENPKPARKRAAAKKATTPRKRAASKPVESESTEPVNEPESRLAGLDKLIQDSVEREQAKSVARVENLTTPELSATVVLSSEGTKVIPDLVHVPAEVAKPKSPWDASSRQDDLLIQLVGNIQDMGNAFTATLGTLVEMVQERK
jgi:hypothetical protein